MKRKKRLIFIFTSIVIVGISCLIYFKYFYFEYKNTSIILDNSKLGGFNTVSLISNGDIITSNRHYLIKYSSKGKELWKKQIRMYITTLEVINDKIIVVGESSTYDDRKINIQAFDVDGNEIWSTEIDNNTNDHYISLTDISKVGDNQFFLTGSSSKENQTKAIMIKMDLDGNIKWEKIAPYENYVDEYGNLFMRMVSILETSDKHYIAVVQSLNTIENGLIIKYNEQGEIVETHEINQGWNNWIYEDSILTSDDKIVITGGYMLYDDEFLGKDCGFLVKYDLNGELIWEKSYSKNDNNNFKSVKEMKVGDLIVVGNTNNKKETDNGLIVMYNKNGKELTHYIFKDPERILYLDLEIDEKQTLYISGLVRDKGFIMKFEKR